MATAAGRPTHVSWDKIGIDSAATLCFTNPSAVPPGILTVDGKMIGWSDPGGQHRLDIPLAAVSKVISKGGGIGLGLASSFKLELLCGEATATEATDPSNPVRLGVLGSEFVPIDRARAGGTATVVFKFGTHKDQRNRAAALIELGVAGVHSPAPQPRAAVHSIGPASFEAVPMQQQLRKTNLQQLTCFEEFNCTLESDLRIYANQYSMPGLIRIFTRPAVEHPVEAEGLCEFHCNQSQRAEHLALGPDIVETVGTFGGGIGLGLASPFRIKMILRQLPQLGIGSPTKLIFAFGTRKAQRNQAASCLKAALSGMHVDDVVEDEQGNEAVDEDNMRMTWTCMDTQTRQIQAATRRKQALMKKKK